uniref:Uncharacterized protein n=1 Tax=Oryza brachyantha TaxID=4533 RepID=J3N5V1_ORYBR
MNSIDRGRIQTQSGPLVLIHSFLWQNGLRNPFPCRGMLATTAAHFVLDLPSSSASCCPSSSCFALYHYLGWRAKGPAFGVLSPPAHAHSWPPAD